MTLVSIFLLVVRGGVVLSLALLLVRFLRGASAALRSTVLAAALLAVAALPLLHALAPTAVSERISAAARELVSAPAMPVAEPVGAAMTSSASAARVVSAPLVTASLPWGAMALALWVIGALAIASRAAVGAVRARKIAARSAPLRDMVPTLLATWRRLGGRVDPPRLVISDEIEAPIVVGALRPVIVVPTVARTWSRDRWRVVLLHELAHVRRRDGATNVIAQLACALHWVNPLVWIAARSLRIEREHAADDTVLRTGTRASAYAEHLVEIAVGAPAPFAALSMAEPSRFEARVVALLDERSRRPAGLRAGIAITASLCAVAALAACMSPASTPPPQSPRTNPPSAATVPAIQATVEAELDRALTEYHGTGALAIVLDAKTGGVVALATRGGLAADTPRINGSTMKPFTIAAALEAGIATAATEIDCDQGERMYGDKKMTDADKHGVLDLGDILAVSSNVGVAKLAEPLGDKLGDALRRYHFTAPAHIDTHSFDGAAIANGEGLAVTSLALASAYTTFANDGVYRAVTGSHEQVMSAQTAQAVHAMLDRVVNSPDGTGRAAQVPGVRVIGKTGTAQTSVDGRYYASFIGIVPADAPRYVILVGVDGVESYGGKVAAPMFARIATAALAH